MLGAPPRTRPEELCSAVGPSQRPDPPHSAYSCPRKLGFSLSRVVRQATCMIGIHQGVLWLTVHSTLYAGTGLFIGHCTRCSR
jgi:hypothetical protein